MFAWTVRADETLESLVDTQLPAHHKAALAARTGAAAAGGASARAFVVGIRIRRRLTRTLHVLGDQLVVKQEAPRSCDLWVSTDEASAEYFLADAKGPRVLTAKPNAAFPVLTPTDPRMLAHIAGESAKLECTLKMPDGTQLSMLFGCGKHAAKGIDDFDPEVRLVLPAMLLTAFTQAEVSPQSAIESPDIEWHGKKLVAVKLALALAPIFAPAFATAKAARS
jgi:hypothetical protein